MKMILIYFLVERAPCFSAGKGAREEDSGIMGERKEKKDKKHKDKKVSAAPVRCLTVGTACRFL